MEQILRVNKYDSGQKKIDDAKLSIHQEDITNLGVYPDSIAYCFLSLPFPSSLFLLTHRPQHITNQYEKNRTI